MSKPIAVEFEGEQMKIVREGWQSLKIDLHPQVKANALKWASKSLIDPENFLRVAFMMGVLKLAKDMDIIMPGQGYFDDEKGEQNE